MRKSHLPMYEILSTQRPAHHLSLFNCSTVQPAGRCPLTRTSPVRVEEGVPLSSAIRSRQAAGDEASLTAAWVETTEYAMRP